MGKHALSTTEGVPDVLRKDLSSSQMEEKTGNSASVWSFITNHAHTFCRSNSSSNIHCGFRKNMRVRWNAAWRRAIIIDPVRCLQERVSGCHKALSSSTSKQPIWLLGVCYNCSSSEGHASNNEIYKQFETDIHSRIWVTYRRGFQVIMGTNITTDVGWGCMIRSAQMLLAQALICHRFGRSWRRSDVNNTTHTCIISPDNPKADTSTYHCSNLKRMPLRTIDPSLALGFYCRDEEDFKDLCGRAVALERKGNGAPIFTVVQSKDELSIKDSHKVTCPQNESIKDINEAEEGWQIL
ncbi:hypothetical protein KP509_33G057200 [Ceratopteris richardii]|uniref:Cysteine protease n=1 Tax=Ceratopteris richardii TaxID=49495 RepID=A0A8T2QR66_CERRI|nr:hypothetical protein KP509_33G057200 [Ceratopteris richardii]